MDLLSQHEAFLRAIFDAPDDDTPRLVYADFLEENGEPLRAEFLRVQCGLARLPLDVTDETIGTLLSRSRQLVDLVVPWQEIGDSRSVSIRQGLWCKESAAGIGVTRADVADPRAFREWVVRVNPAWYGETRLHFRHGPPLLADHVRDLLELPFLHHACTWDLSGRIEESPTEGDSPPDVPDSVDGLSGYRLTDMTLHPAITTPGVEELVRHRGVRRITSLDLRNNNLDNDAARALVVSPYLDNLKRLRLLEGNRLRGKVWQQVIARFGDQVVG